MTDLPESKRIKKESIDAAMGGINQFLNSMRGAELCGATARATRIDDNTIQIAARDQYFTVKISAHC